MFSVKGQGKEAKILGLLQYASALKNTEINSQRYPDLNCDQFY